MNDLAVRTGPIQAYLAKQMNDLAAACPQHLTPERLLSVLSICIYRTPELQECEPASIKAAVIQAAALDLDLNPTAGEAYLIPRRNRNAGNILECTFMPGYRGLAKLSREAAGLNYLQAELVRAKDKFRVWRNPDWQIEHEPIFGNAGGPVTHVYAVAKLPTGEHQIAVLTRDEIEDIRKRSQFPNAGPWVKDWGEMAKKTAIKRLCKLLPNRSNPQASDRLNAAIEADNREYEDGPREHHAINHDNGTGHGSGAYADPETVRAYSAWVKALADDINGKWLDHHTDASGEVPPGLKDLLSEWQLSGHLLKWARSNALVNAPDDVRAGQRDKFAAVAWQRCPDDFEEEARRYGREKWKEARAAMKPAALPGLEAEAEDAPEDDPDVWPEGRE